MIIYNIGNNRPVRVEVKVDDTRDELVAIITSIEGSADTTVIPLGSVTSLGVRVGAWEVAAVGRSVLDYALGPHRPSWDAAPGAGMSHHCHARGCRRACPPRHLMCARHWRMVPERLRTRVWATYRAGQETDKRPSSAWLEAADAAIDAVAEIEAEARRHDELARRQIGFDFGRLR